MKILADIHTHSVASGHAYSTIDENYRFAASKGLEMVALTEHGPAMAGTTNYIFFANLGALPETLHGVRLLKGIELNIVSSNGDIDLEEEYLKQLDLSLASLHIPTFSPMSRKDNTSAYLKAMENPWIDIIGHPGDPRYDVDYDAVYQVAKDTKTLLEMNNCSLIPGGFRDGSDKIMTSLLEKCATDGVPIVMGSDAHFYANIGDVARVEALLKKISFPEELVLNTNPKALLANLKRNLV